MRQLTDHQETILTDTRQIFEKKTEADYITKRKVFLKSVFPKIEELYASNPNEFEEISQGLYTIMFKQEVIHLTNYLKAQDYKGLNDYKIAVIELFRPKCIILEKTCNLRLFNFLVDFEKLVQHWMDSENGSRAVLKEVIKDDGFCYIATMVYGDYNHPNVIHLRKFRDNKLNKNKLGKMFVKFYYRYSPSWVKKMENNALINQLLKVFIDLIINKTKK